MPSLRRRLLSSGNFALVVVLLGVLFIMVNYISSQRYARWDFTKTKITALSDQTVRILKGLNDPLSVIVFYQPTHQLYGLVKDLLAEYARVNPRVQIEYVDPVQDFARAKQLVQTFQIDPSDPETKSLVIFQSGTRHKFLSEVDLADYDYSSMSSMGKPRVTFKGEAALTSAILSVTQATQPLLWFTSGHGEKSLESLEPTGLSELKKSLEQRNNMRVESVTLLQRAIIPPEVKLVVIAGSTRRFTDQEVGVLETYLEHGGRLLALIDPLNNTGLDGLLERWGIELGMDIVVDPARALPFVSAANLLVTTYTQHPIVERMARLVTLFPLARSVRPAQPVPAGLRVTPLALTSPEGWGETRTSNEQFQYNEGEDLKGPVPIAVAVERLPASPASQADSSSGRTRLVVIGDSDFIVNTQLGNVGNQDFLQGAVYWLIDQPQLIGIGPKLIDTIRLNLTAGQLMRIQLGLLTMPLLCGLVGVGTWWLRRT